MITLNAIPVVIRMNEVAAIHCLPSAPSTESAALNVASVEWETGDEAVATSNPIGTGFSGRFAPVAPGSVVLNLTVDATGDPRVGDIVVQPFAITLLNIPELTFGARVDIEPAY